MASPTPLDQTVEKILLASFNGPVFTRYLNAASVTCALYDHLLVLSVEIETLWSRKLDLPKVLYLLIRYGIEGSLLYSAFVMSGFNSLDTKSCQAFITVICYSTLIITFATQVYVIYHHYMFWDRRKGILLTLVALMVLLFVPAVYLGARGATQWRRNFMYFEPGRACLLTVASNDGRAMWGCLAAFDALATVIMALNSLDRPYRARSDILSSLRRDGVIWFTIVFAFRIANVIASALAQPESSFVMGFPSWAMMAALYGRIILRTESLKKTKALRSGGSIRIWNGTKNAFEMNPMSSTSSRSDTGH